MNWSKMIPYFFLVKITIFFHYICVELCGTFIPCFFRECIHTLEKLFGVTYFFPVKITIFFTTFVSNYLAHLSHVLVFQNDRVIAVIMLYSIFG